MFPGSRASSAGRPVGWLLCGLCVPENPVALFLCLCRAPALCVPVPPTLLPRRWDGVCLSSQWKILPGLYIGNFKDARDAEQLSRNKVTHILSVHDSARPMLEGVKYLCIPAADSPSQNLTRHFRESIKFIHECRLGGEGCLVHWYVHLWPAAAAEQSLSVCEGLLHLPEPRTHTPRPCWLLAGVSRSVTLVVAYIMTVTDFGWEDALHTVRAGRSCANPNLGFQRQLQEFEKHQVHQFRQWLREEYGENPLRDAEAARSILAASGILKSWAFLRRL
ncbi:dual specificity protein phosphatase 22 isoform X1 [Camelus ferus]|uniref:Dual specificity protein phosphatase 22 isoform X1 n=1 Tax=Camelus ferus TaxID=419612 RepID=A0A8B8RJX3_CAMFR|nr:dual specificity protein phosphatase 22 isoform X1 [Camelus ferus]